VLFGEAHDAAIIDFAADPRNENDPLPTQFLPEAELPLEPTGDTDESELSTEVRDRNRRVIDVMLTS
jgi:hypothetical protein